MDFTLLLADYAEKHENTNTFSAKDAGLSEVKADSEPVAITLYAVVVLRLSAIEGGEHKVALRFLGASSHEEVAGFDARWTLRERTGTAIKVFRLSLSLSFGRYVVEGAVDGAVRSQLPFRVTKRS